MKLLVDTREQSPLEFVATDGVEIEVRSLPVGDYQAEGQACVVERKSIPDLFGSFSSNYEAERNKMIRAKENKLKYILAIEESATEVRKGHTYWKNGQQHESAKTGISQMRQLMTISRKYGVEVWFCAGRKDMAFRIMEYFLAGDRLPSTTTAFGGEKIDGPLIEQIDTPTTKD